MGPFNLACHRVGHSAAESIWESFPNNVGAAAQLYDPAQIFIPGMEPSARPGFNRVLAHLGNVDDGLAAVYVCEPGEVVGRRITAWVRADVLWIASPSPKPEKSSSDRIPDETITEPVIRRRVDKRSESEQA